MDFKIALHKVGKAYSGVPVFSNISCVFVPGKSYVLAGANGSGKSTLLRIICGLLSPSTGKVQVKADGSLLTQTHERGKIMGLLSPYLNLYDRLTALENLSFFAALHGTRPSTGTLTELLECVRLTPFKQRQVGTFSSGMQQRLKLAFALMHRPMVLLLDEPFTNLDVEGKEIFAAVIETQRQQGTVVMATNEGNEVEKYGEEIIYMAHHSKMAGVERFTGRV